MLVTQTVHAGRRRATTSAQCTADRTGYKAGALAHALPLAQGEFIALFDADCAAARLLRHTIPHFLAPDAARIGFAGVGIT
ncbi:MAG: hypothetical protein R2838_15670 [Caldilineaceae bacterium]